MVGEGRGVAGASFVAARGFGGEGRSRGEARRGEKFTIGLTSDDIEKAEIEWGR